MITKIMTRVVSVLFGSLLLINLVGCSQDIQMSDYVKTVQSGIERLP
jgi:hypothetical protein